MAGADVGWGAEFCEDSGVRGREVLLLVFRTIEVEDPVAGAPRRFYRVRIQLIP